jgi:hypothetical protein
MEQTSILKKEASDERLRCIESERMVNLWHDFTLLITQTVPRAVSCALTVWSFQGNFHSEDDLHKFQKAMEQTSILKKEASDERLRRIESERMVNL